MKKKVLFTDNQEHRRTIDTFVALTFLSGSTDEKGLLYFVAELGLRLVKLYPKTQLYYLEYMEQDDGGPGYEMIISIIPLRNLKKLCMELEVDSNNQRIADIDVFISLPGKFGKISRQVLDLSSKD